MNIGCSTLPFFRLPAARAVEAVAGYGFSAAEILCESPHAHPDELGRQARDEIMLASRRCNVGLLLHAPISDVNLMSPNPGARAEAVRQIAETVRLARDLECPRIVFHAGGRPGMGMYDPEKSYRDLMDGLESLLRTAERYGVGLLIENDPKKPGLGAYLPEICRKIVEAFEGRLLFLLDVAHAFTVGEDVPGVFIRELAPYLGGVHISNNFGEFDEHNGLDNGGINIPGVISRLREASFRREAVLEVMRESDIPASMELLGAL